MKLKKTTIICSIFFLVIVCAFCIYYFFLLKPSITLIGEKYITIPLNSEFVDPGFITDKNNKIDIKVKGKVDTSKIGEYKITYIVKEHDYTVKIERIIKVIDITAPIITLKGGENITLCQNEKYNEVGYTAIDDYEGDLTNKVEISNNDNNIIYKVKDSSNNETIATRSIVYEDKTAPIITLKGYQTTSLIVGSKYYESGYTVSDNCDSNINSKVKVIGSVNYNVVGTYYIYYEVIDEYGNSTRVARTVHIKNPPSPKNSTIYLTFDDGPSPITSNILDILKDEGVPATFFVLNRGDGYNHLIKRAFDEGHSIGLHGNSHNYGSIYTSIDSYFNDLSIISNKVLGITGVESKIIRFPGGSSNTVSSFNSGIMSRLTKEVMDRGYVYFDWNVGSEDTKNISSSQIYKSVISQVGSYHTYVVLMHDYNGNYKTVNALRDIIHTLKQNGYNFGKITTSTPQIKHKVNN